MKRKSTILLFNRDGLIAVLVFVAICSTLSARLLDVSKAQLFSNSSQRTLTFEDRVVYQRAIEEIYWRHRTWAKENIGPKPPIDRVISQAQVQKKVADYLHKSQALQDYWQRPITAEQLQAEINRMAKQTRQPDVLHELFEALGNDPFVIAECLGRPALADRLLTNWYGRDQRIHARLKQRVEAELQEHRSIEQMKQLSGKYHEVELIRSDTSDNQTGFSRKGRIELNGREWDETVRRLASLFRRPAMTRRGSVAQTAPIPQIKRGELSALQEDATRYYATAIINSSSDRLKVATVSWLKEPVESWLDRAEREFTSTVAGAAVTYILPTIADGSGCSDDTWTATAGPPDSRYGEAALWTGSEMIIWGGGYGFYPYLLFRNTGARYNPSTDTWTNISPTGAPTARVNHTAVWTGDEMIIWGGSDEVFNTVNTGGKYNPATNSWTPTSTINAPSARVLHTAIWTGDEMIVWGGTGANYFNTGGKYNPNANTWTATTTVNAPDARYGATAVWTGSEMIIWGGTDGATAFNTGGRYNSNTNNWTPTSVTNAPNGREAHTAIWSGSDMIVWGGGFSGSHFNTGGRYSAGTNSWTATSMSGAPVARSGHTAVWTGNEMIVWGGAAGAGAFDTGGRYNPVTNSWTATATTNVPLARSGHDAVWTGSEMIVWGGTGSEIGDLNTGGRYNPVTNSWTPTNIYNTPEPRVSHTAVWTGIEMIIWGGDVSINAALADNGKSYNAATDTWVSITTLNAPTARAAHQAIWTGAEMVIWGGHDENFVDLNTGGKYNPVANAWIPTSISNAPAPRESHTAIWTGNEMIIWGGYDGFDDLNTGARYNPTTDSWTVVSTTGAPIPRDTHTAVWAGDEMIVWGGWNFQSQMRLNTGGRYDPATDNWTATSTNNAPDGRTGHSAVWTGGEMIVWGGSPWLNTGGRYNPISDSWTATSIINTPSGRYFHTAIWSGREMIVWGGQYYDPGIFGNVPVATGGRYNPASDNWIATNLTNAPDARSGHTAIWSGSEMIVWGGYNNDLLNTGARYCAQSGPPPTPTPTPTPCTGRCTPTPRPRATPHPRP